MSEEKPQQKRQVAHKIMIKDLLEGRYIKEEGWNPNYIKLKDGREISRANILGAVVDKLPVKNITQQSVLIDDGSANINLRLFEETKLFDNIKIGDLVIIIGKPREFNKQIYVVPEIIKKIDDNNWIKLRKLELNRKKTKKRATIKEESIIEEDIITDDNDVLSIIKTIDKGEGVDINDIITNSKNKDIEKIINNMIKIGELFEITPGKIKILE